MKKWRQFFQQLFIRHIAGPEPVISATTRHTPTADYDLIRFAVWKHLRTARAQEQVLLDYGPEYALIVDELRMEGWRVQLHAGPDGTLAYVISADRSGLPA